MQKTLNWPQQDKREGAPGTFSKLFRAIRYVQFSSAFYSTGVLHVHCNSTFYCIVYLEVKIYKTIKFPVVLYDCEAWSLTLREECRLRVFENRILRRKFRPERDGNGEWRRLHNEELHSLYRSPNIVRVIKSR